MDNILSILGLLISFSTLILGIIAYNKFLLKQLKQKQIDVVFDLLIEIQKSINIYHFNNEDKPMYGELKTIWDLLLIPQADYDTQKLYFLGKDNNDSETKIVQWDFYYKYYSNPILPIKIADKLKAFNNTNWKTVKYDSIKNDNCIIIGPAQKIKNDRTCFYISDTPIETFKGLIKATFDLRKSIEDWFRLNGIKHLNFTTSHHFIDKG